MSESPEVERSAQNPRGKTNIEQGAEPSVDKTDATEPSVDKTDATEPSVDKTDATEPSVDKTDATEPSVDKTDATEPVRMSNPKQTPSGNLENAGQTDNTRSV
jgi:hypothetical protein